MGAFTLDTSGAIRLVPAKSDPDGPIIRWSDIDLFTQGFIRAMFESAFNTFECLRDCRDPCDDCLDANPRKGFSELSPAALERIVRDCGEMVRVRIAADMPTDAATGASYWRWRQDGMLTSWPALTVSLDDAGKVTLADRVAA